MPFVPSALLALFALTFLFIWWLECRRSLLLFALAFGALGLAIFSQVARLPADGGLNTLLSAALYLGGVWAFGAAVLARSGRRLPWRLPATALLVVLGLLGYFYYGDRDLTVRVYLLNSSMGALLLYVAWCARFLRQGGRRDRAMLWLVLLLGLHFFPRMLFTGDALSSDMDEFANLAFWRGVLVTLSTLGAAAGIGVLLITGLDVMVTLREERDRDSLTGVLNRRGLETRVTSWIHGRRSADRSAVVVCDIDRFKRINDEFGHGVGDQVLVGFAQLLQHEARHDDLVARLGGEEFAIVLRDCPVDRAVALAERLRDKIETTSFDGMPAHRPVTCSFGVTALNGNDLWRAIERADRYLYAAKRSGRNRTVADGAVSDE